MLSGGRGRYGHEPLQLTMKLRIFPGSLRGALTAPPSKSALLRLTLLAALGDGLCEIDCSRLPEDAQYLCRALAALGASVGEADGRLHIGPIGRPAAEARIDCGESAAVLRFLLPLAAALGTSVCFTGSARLLRRPIAPLLRAMEAHGCRCDTAHGLSVSGRLVPGDYTLPGGVSSQFFSGLLMALPLLPGESRLRAAGPLVSAGYIDMTRQMLTRFGVRTELDGAAYVIPGGQRPSLPAVTAVPGDWSGAAVWMAANALGSAVTVRGLDPESPQPDRRIQDYVNQMPPELDVSQHPDLLPMLAVLATAGKHPVRLVNAARLRTKESDRLRTAAALVTSLGGSAEVREDGLALRPGRLRGGTADAAGDHRIAMAAALAATVCTEPVTLAGADCVKKSYPAFWEDFYRVGGRFEIS